MQKYVSALSDYLEKKFGNCIKCIKRVSCSEKENYKDKEPCNEFTFYIKCVFCNNERQYSVKRSFIFKKKKEGIYCLNCYNFLKEILYKHKTIIDYGDHLFISLNLHKPSFDCLLENDFYIIDERLRTLILDKLMENEIEIEKRYEKKGN